LGVSDALRYNAKMEFEIIGDIKHPETFARGSGIRELPRLRKIHGQGLWRKRKGFATVRLQDGTIREAEIHWYEASGIGKREFKIKRYIDTQP
jgi:hypothetical protein